MQRPYLCVRAAIRVYTPQYVVWCVSGGDYIKSMAVKPARRATAQLMSFAQRKLFLLSARSGMEA